MATLRQLAETALTNYLGTAGVPGQILDGCSAYDKTPPLVICTAISWEDEAIGLGAFKVDYRIDIKFHCSDGKDAFDTLCGAVWDALWLNNANLVAALNALLLSGGLAVQGVSNPHKGEFSTSDDIWIESLFLSVTMIPA